MRYDLKGDPIEPPATIKQGSLGGAFATVVFLAPFVLFAVWMVLVLADVIWTHI